MEIKADTRTRDKEGLARELDIPREVPEMAGDPANGHAVNGESGRCKPMRQRALELPRIRSA
jgi:hypothetical protein